MQLFIKSAGFSVNQDYSWVDPRGGNAGIDLPILDYNVDSVKFIWKSTDTAIYIFGNAFVDNSRLDLYNRPLRNYILLQGRIQEAAYMHGCFEKMLLDQEGFTNVLNSSICNAGMDSRTGFTVDWDKIHTYFNAQINYNHETGRLKRHLYEEDSYDARKELLRELRGELGNSVTFFVGGTLSGQRLKALAPDRALLSHVDPAVTANCQSPDFGGRHTTAKMLAVTLGACALGSAIFVLAARKKIPKTGLEVTNEKRYRTYAGKVD